MRIRKTNLFGYLALVCVFAIACGGLSFWQYTRAQTAAADNQILETNLQASPEPLESVTEENLAREDLNWKLVRVSGRYLYDKQLFLKNVLRKPDIGFAVLTPLQMSNGKILIVKRGWVKNAQQTPPDVTQVSEGKTIVLRLQRPTQQTAQVNRVQINHLNLSTIKSHISGDVITHFYAIPDLVAATNSTLEEGFGKNLDLSNKEDGGEKNRHFNGDKDHKSGTDKLDDTGRPRVENVEGEPLWPGSSQVILPIKAILPIKNVGMHWSYAFQWVIFAVAAFLAFFWYTKTVAKSEANSKTAPQARNGDNKHKMGNKFGGAVDKHGWDKHSGNKRRICRKRTGKKLSDEEYEDWLQDMLERKSGSV